MNLPNYEEATNYIRTRLRYELSPNLLQHNLAHTDDVVKEGLGLAYQEGIGGRDFIRLATGLVFHDSGYLFQYHDNEEFGAGLVGSVLPNFEYSVEDVIAIAGVIRATQWPQRPHSLLEQIGCDADVANFGRDDFFDANLRLWEEGKFYGSDLTLHQWYSKTLLFVGSHNYFTKSASLKWNRKKAENVDELKRRIEEVKLEQFIEESGISSMGVRKGLDSVNLG